MRLKNHPPFGSLVRKGVIPTRVCVRSFFQKDRLLKHLRTDHQAMEHRCLSSVQLRIVRALSTQTGAIKAGAWFLGAETELPQVAKPLRWSAHIMRQMLTESPSYQLMRSSITNYDNMTIWVWSETGVKLVIRADAETLGLIRLTQKLFCTSKLLELILTLCIWCHSALQPGSSWGHAEEQPAAPIETFARIYAFHGLLL